jgi:hypothetical protein
MTTDSLTDPVAGEPAAGTAAPPRRRFRPPARRAIAAITAGVVIVVTATVLAIWLPRRSNGSETTVPPQWARTAVTADGLPERSGVQLVRVALTGGGGLLDLRFKVVDPSKAAALHDPRTPPALIDERTGLVINQLLMDHSHTGDFQAAVTYYLVFENTGGWVQRGGSVTVLLGDAQVENVVVQ